LVGGTPPSKLTRDSEEGLEILDEAVDVEGLFPEMRSVELLEFFDLLHVLLVVDKRAHQNYRAVTTQFHVVDQSAEPAAVHFAGFGDDQIGEGPEMH